MGKKPISRKSLIINIFIMLTVTGLTIFYLSRYNFFSKIKEAEKFPIYGFFFLGIFMLITILCDSFIIYRSFKIINPIKYKDAIGAYLYGNIGSYVTPGRAGHYPFMIYYYEKKGKSIDEILNSTTQNQFLYSFVLVIVYGIIAIVANCNNYCVKLSSGIYELKFFAIIGILSNIAFSLIFVVLAFCKPINDIVIKICGYFAVKLKKFPSKEEYKAYQSIKMEACRKQIKYIVTHFYRMIPSMLAFIIFIFFSYGLPYWVYLFITKESFSFSTFFLFLSLNQCLTYIANLVPTPGGTGVFSFTFLVVFQMVIPVEGTLNLCMLIWRFFSYYYLLIIDIIYFLISMSIDTNKGLHINKELLEKEKKN